MISGKGRVAVITGASSGIGREAALALAKSGWSIVLSGRRQAELEATAQACEGVRTMCVAGDVSVEDNVKSLFDQAKKEFGRVDMLFNVGPRDGPWARDSGQVNPVLTECRHIWKGGTHRGSGY